MSPVDTGAIIVFVVVFSAMLLFSPRARYVVKDTLLHPFRPFGADELDDDERPKAQA
jgi:hypothetical protein